MFQDFAISHPKQLNRQTLQFSGVLAANAGATVVGRIPLLANIMGVFQLLIKMAAGDTRQLTIEAVTAGSDTVTITAHGFVTGSPVMIGFLAGGALPGGVSGTTIYYARAADANTLAFYSTKAQSIAGGPTGLLDLTSGGTTPVVIGVVEQAFYIVRGAVRNRNGKVELLGTPNQIALEDVAAWDGNLTADDSNDAASITLTPDVTLNTRYDIVAEYFTESVNA